MIKLAEKNLCTGCGACAYRCPKGCIEMKPNNIGIMLPVVDYSACIECQACQRVCPVINEPQPWFAKKAYAAWSNDEEERRTSASGGIAIELYKQALTLGYKVVGASQNCDFGVTMKMTSVPEELVRFKNSKYVFSSAYDVYPEIKQVLKEDQKVLFIGLPCQTAALRQLFKDNENLLLVDLVCHGSTPLSYLQQHINMLCRQANQNAVRMSFRDPETYTYTYTFTLYNSKNERFYAKRTKDGDTYQFAYHRMISYRENCYHCKFAHPKRHSDITLADYSGLGALAPCDFSARKVSLILENTEKGSAFIQKLINNRKIIVHERPLEEPFQGQPRLRFPNPKSKYRNLFEQEIEACNGDFEAAIRKPMAAYRRDEIRKTILRFPIRIAKKVVKTIIRKK